MGLCKDGHTLNTTNSGCGDFLCVSSEFVVQEGGGGKWLSAHNVMPELPLGAKEKWGDGKGGEMEGRTQRSRVRG